jgi:hypothetical protein
MRSLIAIAALVASVSVSAGGLDGKGIKCVLVDWIDPILVSFQDGVATHFVLSMRGTKALIEVDKSDLILYPRGRMTLRCLLRLLCGQRYLMTS